jgi:hypothetical protein
MHMGALLMLVSFGTATRGKSTTCGAGLSRDSFFLVSNKKLICVRRDNECGATRSKYEQDG